ncbi:hypothetical protein M422DRAFT_250724 [Sphaerobolus stellatus SS14]|uniref:Uncharacterized protein n=1 Tax=Sphaerobolus stellatus (strain SS14) TaxID=990650 RepID=A0A0C9W2U1_SPHS4|nr:hypothetical protein M422DRAFT_250724 [Sphaerobolus stellatus SS14]
MLFNIPFVCSATLLLAGSVTASPAIFARQGGHGGGGSGGGGQDPGNQGNITAKPTEIGTPQPNATTPEPPSGTPGGVLLCEQVEWSNCNYTVLQLDECYDLKEKWNRTISSLGPDNGTVLLTYEDVKCSGNGTGWLYPGSPDIRHDGWNDKISSIKAISDTSYHSH